MRASRFLVAVLVASALLVSGPVVAGAKLTFAPDFADMLYGIEVQGHSGSPICYGMIAEDDRIYASTYSGLQVFHAEGGPPILVGDWVNPWGGPDAMTPYGTDLWTAFGTGIGRFDCADEASPTPDMASYFDVSERLDWVYGMEAASNHLFVAGKPQPGQDQPMFVYDISDPSSPTTAAAVTADGAWFMALEEGGMYGWVGCYDTSIPGSMGQLWVMDLSAPATPTIEGKADLGATVMPRAVTMDFGYAYLACSDTVQGAGGGLAVVDVSDVTSPTAVVLPGEVGPDLAAWDVAVVGDTLYVLYETERSNAPSLGQVVAYDISAPGTPTVAGTFERMSWTQQGTPQIATAVTAGGYLAVGDSHGLALVGDNGGRIYLRWRGPAEGMRARTVGGLSYVTDEWGGFSVVDVSEPGTLTPLGSYRALGEGSAMGVEVTATRAYYSADASESGSIFGFTHEGVFRTMDVSDPTSPTPLGSLDTTWVAYDIRVDGDVAYAGTAGSGLMTLDVSNPAAPAIIGQVLPDVPGGAPHVLGVALNGDHAYATYADEGFGQASAVRAAAVVDVSDPAAPSIVETFGPDVTGGWLYGAEVDQDFLYVSGDNGVFVYDLTDPDDPRRVGHSGDFPAAWFDVSGDSSKISCGLGGGVGVLDIADPFSPTPISFAGPFWTNIWHGGFSGSTLLGPGPGLWSGRSITPTPSAEDTRLAGGTRHATSAEVSEYLQAEGSEYVVVATGASYPDALVGAPLAYALRAPLLLVQKDDVPVAVETEITRLGAKRAVVLGGTGAVSDAVVTELKSLLGTTSPTAVERVAGADRYATASRIATRLAEVLGSDPDKAYIATGQNFPDALSVSGVASRLGRPIMLVRKDSVPAPTAAALTSLGVTDTIVVGGASAVNDTVYGLVGASDRLAGASRYATSRAIADHALANGFMRGRLYVATGVNFPDALAAGPACAAQRAPLLLTSPPLSQASLAPVRDYLQTHRGYVRTVVVIGGSGPMPQSLVDEILAEL